ncbi:MAG TPA: chemotaxis protein CheW [Tissierellaceae bacterium]
MAESQYVVFKLGKSEFGIDIMNVKEIGTYVEAVSLPNTPSFIEGVINYRGKVIPVINLKKRFNLGDWGVTKDTRIIVITLNEKEVGFIVDEASQTIRLNDEQIDPAPSFVGGIDKRYITGVGKLDDNRLLILIDLEKVLNDDEIEEIERLEV